jgi:malate synthase
MNHAPTGFAVARDLPQGFAAFFHALHAEFASRQKTLAAARRERLARAHANGALPDHLPPSPATTGDWRIELPAWCADQRNQMTGPADDAELVVKMLNSGAPGVMLDLEDSMANAWPNLMRGVRNIARRSRDADATGRRRGRRVGIEPSSVAIWNRVRGLHLSQAGVVDGETTSASLFDLALIAWRVEPERLRHPLAIYIPKSESAEEARGGATCSQAVAPARGWPRTRSAAWRSWSRTRSPIRWRSSCSTCATTSSGLNLGRWDYMASLIHFNLPIPRGCCPIATRFRTTCRSSSACASCSWTSVTAAARSRSAA